MSFQVLKEAFESPTLTISKLLKFRKECLKDFCKVKCNKMSDSGKRVLKERYVQALFSAVSGYKVSDTRAKESTLEA